MVMNQFISGSLARGLSSGGKRYRGETLKVPAWIVSEQSEQRMVRANIHFQLVRRSASIGAQQPSPVPEYCQKTVLSSGNIFISFLPACLPIPMELFSVKAEI